MAVVTGVPAAPVPAHRRLRDARLPRRDRDVTAVPVGRSPLSERAQRFRVTSRCRSAAEDQTSSELQEKGSVSTGPETGPSSFVGERLHRTLHSARRVRLDPRRDRLYALRRARSDGTGWGPRGTGKRERPGHGALTPSHCGHLRVTMRAWQRTSLTRQRSTSAL